jgi:hypothetical protein
MKKSTGNILIGTTIAMTVFAIAGFVMYGTDQKFLSQIKKDNPNIVVRAEFTKKWNAIKAAA